MNSLVGCAMAALYALEIVMQPLAIGTVLKNQYCIVRLVGGGGMAWSTR